MDMEEVKDQEDITITDQDIMKGHMDMDMVMDMEMENIKQPVGVAQNVQRNPYNQKL